jgi:ferrous iron transport protein B
MSRDPIAPSEPAKCPAKAEPQKSSDRVIALVGNPNAGKSTLFNALTGLKAKTGNYSGTTVEKKFGPLKVGDHTCRLIDLPGVYNLKPVTDEERLTCEVLKGQVKGTPQPDIVVIIADASNLSRHLFMVSQILELNIPAVLALNMFDLAERNGLHIDVENLAEDLNCPVIPMVATAGKGIGKLKETLSELVLHPARKPMGPIVAPHCDSCGTCPFTTRYSWSEDLCQRNVKEPVVPRSAFTEKIDVVLTHPVMGFMAFLGIMIATFFLIFEFATLPMDLIETLFGTIGEGIAGFLPDNDFESFVVEGIIGGVGGMLVFLPQIIILFFLITLLEDSGYLSRAAFVMDRVMRFVGLPGSAFIPMLASHACAIPAIMGTRVIKDKRDRLLTILVAPLMTCSARIPVYAILIILMFGEHTFIGAVVFAACYFVGIGAALVMAFIFRKTILPGKTSPLVIELPNYKIPDFKVAINIALSRGWIFVKQAGTVILVISMILWVLLTYPKSDAPAHAVAMAAEAAVLEAAGESEQATALRIESERQTGRYQQSRSFAGRLGKVIEPVIKPLGFDWQIGIGIISSFAAREAIVATLAIVYGAGEDAADEEGFGRLRDKMSAATRENGTPVYSTPACLSLLVFYILAMQCLPTQVVTKRETGSWKWAGFQLAYMSVLAWVAAFVTYRIALIWLA